MHAFWSMSGAVRKKRGCAIQNEMATLGRSTAHADRALLKFIETAPNAMVLVDPTGIIDMVNAPAERLFGYSRSEMVGQYVEILVPERFRMKHPGLRQSFLASPEARPMGAGRELYALHKDGSEVPVEIGLNPIETENGMMVLSAIVDISDRKMKEQKILQALKEKEAMLGEIHHRVKNNLQMIDSLLSMQSDTIQDASIKSIFRDSQNRIKSMALIHQILYQSNNFAEVDFGRFLDRLLPALTSSYSFDGRAVSLEIGGGPVSLPISAAIPCGLLVNELITNALKHAFPDRPPGRIRVETVGSADGDIVISVSDDGVGLPPDLDVTKTETLGLQLVHVLADQLRGTLDIRRADPTQFTLSFHTAVSEAA